MHAEENLTVEQVSWGEKLIHCSKSKVPPKGLFNTTCLQVARVLTLQHLKQSNLPTVTMCSSYFFYFFFPLRANSILQIALTALIFFQRELGELKPIHAYVTWCDLRRHSDQIRRHGEKKKTQAASFMLMKKVTLPTFILAIGLVVETQTCDAQKKKKKKDKSHV